MSLKTVSLLLAATIVALLTYSDAQAWGGAHVGYTHVGPHGVYHCGATAVRGPYGAYGGVRVTGATAYGGAVVGGAYHYSAGYHACAYGGFHCGRTIGVYHAGVYRR
jgi:hypothetical protein